jgi:hypothetical protein
MSLSSQIIRLAHERPEFRDDLQPLLYLIAAKKDESKKVDQKEYGELRTYGPRFGVVSAHKGSDERRNKIHHARLLADIARLGYRKVTPLRGPWELVPEDAILLRNVRPEDLFELGRKYEQEYVVYQGQSGIMGFYHLQGEPRARVVVDPKGDSIFRGVSDMTAYSLGKGLDLEWGLLWSREFPWDGRNPLTRDQVRQMLKREELNVESV